MLEVWKGIKINSVRNRILTVYYSLNKEIGTYVVCGLVLEELELRRRRYWRGLPEMQAARWCYM